ncbi:MAG: cell wall-binding repeat-containing protein, partial [Kineosporiaceae bacterium]
VARDAVPAAVAAYLAAHPPATILVVGGPDTVSDAVVSGLAGTGRSVTRVAGVDRYATAALVAQRIGAPAGFAVVAPGDDAALATTAAAASVAAAADRPLLLVPGDAPGAAPPGTPTPSPTPSPSGTPTPTPSPSGSPTPSPSPPGTAVVPPAVAAALRALGVRGAVCAGMPAELPEVVRLALPRCARVAGPDAAGTAAALVRSFDRTVALRTVAVSAAGPAQLTDAIAGGALGLPVLYAGRTAPTATVTLLQGEPGIARLTVLGGPAGVSDAVVSLLRRA